MTAVEGRRAFTACLFLILANAALQHVKAASTTVYTTVPACTEAQRREYMANLNDCVACIEGSASKACPTTCCVKQLKGQIAVCKVGSCCVRIIGDVLRGAGGMFLNDEVMLPEGTDADSSCLETVQLSDKCKMCATAYNDKREELPCKTVSAPKPSTAYRGPATCSTAAAATTTTPAPKPKVDATPEVDQSPVSSTAEPDDAADNQPIKSPEVIPYVSDADDTPEQAETVASTCFPDFATVRLHSGESKRMRDLLVGDVVQVSETEYSPVFMFTHRSSAESAGQQRYIRLVAASGDSVTLTSSHYIYADGALKRAGAVHLGDVVTLANGSSSRIVNVETVRASAGLYNPQTLHGDIVVNGVVVSTYTTAVEPSVAHAALLPLRTVYGLFQRFISVENGKSA